MIEKIDDLGPDAYISHQIIKDKINELVEAVNSIVIVVKDAGISQESRDSITKGGDWKGKSTPQERTCQHGLTTHLGCDKWNEPTPQVAGMCNCGPHFEMPYAYRCSRCHKELVKPTQKKGRIKTISEAIKVVQEEIKWT